MRPGESVKLIIGRRDKAVGAEGLISNANAPPFHRHTLQQPQVRMNQSLQVFRNLARAHRCLASGIGIPMHHHFIVTHRNSLKSE